MSPEDVRQLTGRVCGYKTKRTAASAALYVNSRVDEAGERLAPYLCPFCDNYHVGHPPSRARRKKIRSALRYLDQHPEVAIRVR